MSTSATALLTRLRTWALVAGLTGLVIALGAMIGGAALWLFAGVAVVFNLAAIDSFDCEWLATHN